ncbi:MAG: aquaporin family protein [Pseudomonadota bacterium]|nr:aquaporin family protein [Pseudomonadota bacterium]
MTPWRKLAAESIGTAFLLAMVVGSGIMGEHLAGGNEAITLLANSLATGAGLLAILLTLGPISGAHLNPAVSFTLAVRGDLSWRDLPGYAVAQVAGAIAGVWATHAMFGLPVFDVATKLRPGGHLIWSEFVATIGLLGTVLLCSRFRNESTPHAVAAYITAAYWFTASTSFANPAVTLGRSITNTFTGIAPMYVVGFIAAQLAAALVASWFVRGTVNGTRSEIRSNG